MLNFYFHTRSSIFCYKAYLYYDGSLNDQENASANQVKNSKFLDVLFVCFDNDVLYSESRDNFMNVSVTFFFILYLHKFNPKEIKGML